MKPEMFMMNKMFPLPKQGKILAYPNAMRCQKKCIGIRTSIERQDFFVACFMVPLSRKANGTRTSQFKISRVS